MSTKIYYAYKYPGAIWEIYEDLYKKLTSAFEDNWRGLVVTSGYRSYEDQFALWKRFEEARNSPFRSDMDLSCSVVLIPEWDATYIILYAQNRWVGSYHDSIVSIPDVEDFSYWNNTDPPEHLTQEEWEARGKKWDDLVGWSPPASKGPTLDVGGLHALMPRVMKLEEFKEWISEELDAGLEP